MLIQSDLGYMSTWLFGLVVAMEMFPGISSVNFAQSSFYVIDCTESERTGKKNSPQKLKFQHFDPMMISVSNLNQIFETEQNLY